MKVYILNHFYADDIYSQTVYKTFDAARDAMVADIQRIEEELQDKGMKSCKEVYDTWAYLDCNMWTISEAKFIDK